MESISNQLAERNAACDIPNIDFPNRRQGEQPSKIYISDDPELMQEWDCEKNSVLGLDPTKLKLRSNKKAWWKCSKGHSWAATIDNRSIGRKCPYCSRRNLLKGDNDLKSTHPEIAADWDMEANAPMRPEDVTAISCKKVSWVCAKCGYKWNTKIRYRTLNGTGCPKCSSVIRGKRKIATMVAMRGSLAKARSDLMEEWDFEGNEISPESITINSNQKAWWVCSKCKHKWKAVISNRVNGRGCPCCSHKQLVPGKNDLATTHPDLAQEWHPTKNGNLTPRDVMFGQARKVWWLCSEGHSFQATLNHRSGVKGTSCPVCNSGRQTSFREQAFFFYLKKIFSDAISRYTADWLGRFELDIFLPSIRTALEYDGAAWHKEENFKREKRKYDLCRKHGIKLIRVKESMPEYDRGNHDLADQMYSIENVEGKDNFARLLRFVIDDLDPRSNKWTRRNLLQIHSPIDINLERDRYKIIKVAYNVKNSLSETHPEIAKEWHPFKNYGYTPTMFTRGSDFKAWWICPICGNDYEASISHRVNGTGCNARACRKRKFAKTYRERHLKKSGGITNQLLLAEWNYERNGNARPEDCSPHSEQKVWWRCGKCGHEWEAKIANRAIGRGCPLCAHRVLVRGKNDLETMFPDIAREWDYEKNGNLKPCDISFSHSKKVWWKCGKCGYSYQVAPNRRTAQNSGCRKCADKNVWSIRRANELKRSGQMLLPL